MAIRPTTLHWLNIPIYQRENLRAIALDGKGGRPKQGH